MNLALVLISVLLPSVYFTHFIVGVGTPAAWHWKTILVCIPTVIFLALNVKEGADPGPSSEK